MFHFAPRFRGQNLRHLFLHLSVFARPLQLSAGLIATALLPSCAEMVKPTPQQAAVADYGKPPTNPKAIVQEFIRNTYKDPYSIQDLQVETPIKYFLTAPPLLGGKTTYGYLIGFSANAKNSFVAYTGVQHHRLLVRDNMIVSNLDEEFMAN